MLSSNYDSIRQIQFFKILNILITKKNYLLNNDYIEYKH